MPDPVAAVAAAAAVASGVVKAADGSVSTISRLLDKLRAHPIARRLVLSPKTVRNHVSNIFSKLHVTDRAQAIVRA